MTPGWARLDFRASEKKMTSPRQDSTFVAARERPSARHPLAEIGIRLLDEAHAAWQRAELECEHALQAWFEGSPRTRAAAYLSYRAALDREQAAAHDLERLWDIASSGHDALATATTTTREHAS
jgi:hypothetical protein